METSYHTWAEAAENILKFFNDKCYNSKKNCFTSNAHGEEIEAILLGLPDLGIMKYDDIRFINTVAIIEKELKKGIYILAKPSDKYASTTATLMYIKTLAGIKKNY